MSEIVLLCIDLILRVDALFNKISSFMTRAVKYWKNFTLLRLKLVFIVNSFFKVCYIYVKYVCLL